MYCKTKEREFFYLKKKAFFMGDVGIFFTYHKQKQAVSISEFF